MHYFDHFLFYTTTVTQPLLFLDEEETRHAATVLRVQQGATIFVTDGKGDLFTCLVEQIDRSATTCRILSQITQKKQKPAIDFFIGIPEKEACESICESLTSLGINRIEPVVCNNCQKEWWVHSWEKFHTRIMKKIVTTAKQSWNAWLPELAPVIPFEKALTHQNDVILVADVHGSTVDEFIQKQTTTPQTLSCWIGPPGGFSPKELEALKLHNASFIKIASYRLRTELAATVLASAIIQKFILN